LVNLWRVADFAGGGLDPEVAGADPAAAVDWLGQGSPVLLSLAVTLNGNPAGGHFVVAIGVGPDGSILIHDPAPGAARTNLNDYLGGFSNSAGQWKAELRGAARFALRASAATRFLLAALSQDPAAVKSLAFDIRSSAGACGLALDLLDQANINGGAAVPQRLSRLQVCDGAQPAYQVSVGAAQPFRTVLTDLASGGASTDLSGSAPAAYQAARRNGLLSLAALQVSFTSSSVVNAATFAQGLAPGSLMAIFGTGLAGTKGNTSVALDGQPVRIVSVSLFQINAEVPLDAATGVHTLTVRSDYGSLDQPVEIRDVAPAIFVVGNPPQGAVVNQSGALNGASSPIVRGQVITVYGTGLGAVLPSGQLSVVSTPVTVLLNNQEFPVSFAGLAPGFIGLYQVNVPMPVGVAPGLDQTLALKQGNAVSNSVTVSIQ